MNFSKQLKLYRERESLSQEQLAEKIYVTRQTISKWENDKTYPDIHNLIALSTLFDITLDELIKGDLVKMKHSVDVDKMNKWAWVMLIFMALTIISIFPAFELWGWYGFGVSFIFWVISMIAGIKIDRMKKDKNIKTYAEIIAFTEGEDLDIARAKRNKKKDFWDKVKIIGMFCLAALILALLCATIWLFVSN